MPVALRASIIVTAYNHSSFIEEALRSVFEQSVCDLEMVVVDDGSSDGSATIINRILDEAPFPVEFIEQANHGQAHAWNQAFAKISGPVIFFLDGDDIWEPDKVEVMLALVNAHPEGGLYQHRMDGEDRSPERFAQGNIFSAWTADGDRFNVAEKGDQIAVFVPSSGLAVRKELLDKIFPVPENLITCPDAYLTRTAVTQGPVYATERSLGRWRDHEYNAGKDDRFDMETFWVPEVMPAINEWYRAHGIYFAFTYQPTTLRGKIRMALRRWPWFYRMIRTFDAKPNIR